MPLIVLIPIRHDHCGPSLSELVDEVTTKKAGAAEDGDGVAGSC